ncbi:MAG: endonuclease/exonuclease/phosphatase family protein [Myxococcota bacterium]
MASPAPDRSRGAADLALLATVAFLSVGLLAPWLWFAGALQALWVHLGLAGVVVVAWAHLAGRGRPHRSRLPALYVLAVLTALLSIAWPPTQTEGPPDLVIVAWNAHASDRDPAVPLAGLADSGADVLVITELTPHWHRAISTLPGFPYQVAAPADGPHGTGLYARYPLVDAVVLEHLPDWPRQTVLATVVHPKRPVRIAGLHTPSPLSPERPTRATEMSQAVQGADVIAGDLNMTPWMTAFRTLRSSRHSAGGCHGTWPGRLAPIGLPLDHVLVAPDLGVSGFTVGPTWGSDHHAVTAELVLR